MALEVAGGKGWAEGLRERGGVRGGPGVECAEPVAEGVAEGGGGGLVERGGSEQVYERSGVGEVGEDLDVGVWVEMEEVWGLELDGIFRGDGREFLKELEHALFR